MKLRMVPQQPLNLSPFELMYGRPFILYDLPLPGAPSRDLPQTETDSWPTLHLSRYLLRDYADKHLPKLQRDIQHIPLIPSPQRVDVGR
jgi:hypothetical protein